MNQACETVGHAAASRTPFAAARTRKSRPPSSLDSMVTKFPREVQECDLRTKVSIRSVPSGAGAHDATLKTVWRGTASDCVAPLRGAT